MDVSDSVKARFSTSSATGKAWWFLGGLAILRNPDTSPRIPAIIEMHFPPGGMSPLHVHSEVDAGFYLFDGEIVVRSGGDIFVARAGDFVNIPHGMPYTIRVTSEEGSHILMVHNKDNFLSLLEELGTPTTELRLPNDGEFNTDPDTITRLSVKYGTPVLGPAISEAEAHDFVANMERKKS